VSTTPGFGDRLARAVAARESQVVLGLDPDPARIGEGAAPASEFCTRVIMAAAPACVAVKPQLAWFERLGSAGWDVLERVATLAAEQGLLVIADAKRGDVDVTSGAYADALVRAPFDAVTVNPLLGTDAVTPFVTVRTSNPGAGDLQDLRLADGSPWYEAVARLVAVWGAAGVGSSGMSDVGAVVGATAPHHLAVLRELMPHQPFLIPGVGAQGGRPEDLGAAFAGTRAAAVVAASRSILYAADPRVAAEALRAQLWDVSG